MTPDNNASGADGVNGAVNNSSNGANHNTANHNTANHNAANNTNSSHGANTDGNNHTRKFGVVTGASSGIGLELARVFVQNGFDVLVVAEDEGIADAASKLGNDGATVDFAQIDLATYDGVEEFYQKIRNSGRLIDAIAINAGVGVGGPFLQTDLDAELNLIALNVSSTVHLAKRVLPDMVSRGQGRVLFTSSIAALTPGPFETVYAASKAFVHSFSEAVRNELKDTGVTVTALQPGATETNFFARAGMLDTKVGAAEKDDPAAVAKAGFEAMMAGKDHVVAGSFKNKIQAVMAEVTPETIKADQHRKMAEPGSANKK